MKRFLFRRNTRRRRGADGPEKCHGMGAEKGLYSVIAKPGYALPYLLDMRERGWETQAARDTRLHQ